MSEQKQNELFPELEEETKDMECEESQDSSGLSIIPYLAVSDKNHIKSTEETTEVEFKKLTSDQKYFVQNEWWLRKEELEREFEERNGFPLSWHLFEMQSILYRERGETTYQLEVSPHSLIIKKKVFLPPIRKSQIPTRDAIVEYSMKSRKRFFEKLLTIDWEAIPTETIKEITLTYPAIYPKDGEVLKSHLHAYSKRVKRFCRDFGGVSFIWKMEFQKRGAPHYHLIIVTAREIPIEVLRKWALESWSDLVSKWIKKQEDYTEEEMENAIELHKKAGIEADGVRKSKQGLISYLVWYIHKGSYKGKAKEYQHEVPKEYQNVGRWWGIYGKKSGILKFKKKIARITEDQFEEYKNRILKTWEKQGKKYKYRGNQRMSLYSL